jgi:hypothetical protein
MEVYQRVAPEGVNAEQLAKESIGKIEAMRDEH